MEQTGQTQLKPPRKPLTPYMRFSKSIWPSVKGQNPEMSVCQIGATIGKMWREMNDEEKGKYNEDFAKDKVKYDEDLQHYLKITGLQASDLVKPRNKKKDTLKQRQQEQQQQQQQQQQQATMAAMQPNQQMQQMMAAQGFMQNQAALQPMNFIGADGTPVQGALPGFSQLWGGMPYGAQNMQGAVIPSSINGGTYYQVVPQQPPQQQQAQQQQQAAQQQVVQQASQASPMYHANSPQVAPASSPSLSSASPASTNPAQVTQEQPQFTQMQNAAPPQSYEQQPQANQRVQQGEANAAVWGWHHSNQPYITQEANQREQLPTATRAEQLPVVQQVHQDSPQGGVVKSDQGTPTREMTTEHQVEASQSQGLPVSQEQRQTNGKEEPNTTSQHMTEAVSQSHNHSEAVHTTAGTEGSAQVTHPSAHTLYNSYAAYQWGQGQGAMALTQNQQDVAKPVLTRELMLETELHHLRSALSEKTKEVQKLTAELEQAYDTIEKLKHERLGANHEEHVASKNNSPVSQS